MVRRIELAEDAVGEWDLDSRRLHPGRVRERLGVAHHRTTGFVLRHVVHAAGDCRDRSGLAELGEQRPRVLCLAWLERVERRRHPAERTLVAVTARVLVFVSLVALSSCAGGDAGDRSASPTTHRTSPTTVAPATTAAPPGFDGSVAVIDDAGRARMPSSWRPGCPVPLEELRLLTIDHWGFDGAEHRGELVVHADHAEAVQSVFRTLFDARYLIERIELVDVYGGDDHASTLANNTSGFNCRSVVGRPGAWSEHAFGRAIDLNPRVNPWVGDPNLEDFAAYLDRSVEAQGLIRAGDAAVVAFEAIGWQWGGYWDTPDYQHFSATGR